MWKYVCVCILLFSTTDILGFNIRTKEKIYMDILKNITQVNDVLQDLLNNYKKLKLEYEAQATPHNELSSEEESNDILIEETAPTIKHRNKNDNLINDISEDFHPVTQMILVDEAYQDYSSDKSHTDGNAQKTGKALPLLTNNIINSRTTNKRKDHDFLNSKFVFSPLQKYSKVNKQRHIKTPNDVIKKPEMKTIETSFNNNKKIPNYITKNNRKPKSTIHKFKNKDHNRKHKQLVHFEAKPILRDSFNNYKYFDDRSPLRHKTLLVILSAKNNNQDDIDDEERRNVFRTDILRDAYGSACLKVAVRTCYKTLLKVMKAKCRSQFTCKRSFKEHFKSHSKTGCIKEFTIQDDNNNQNPNNAGQYFKMGKNRQVSSSVFDDLFQDITRSNNNFNYYDICLPVMITGIKNDAVTLDKLQLPKDFKTEPINVLRDKYERECRQMSREKCDRACQYSYTETCAQHTCMRAEKRAFSKNCRLECKHAFLPNGYDSDSYSDSTSDTDTDSDSDDDSDVSFSSY